MSEKTNKFYLAVTDVTIFKGTTNNMVSIPTVTRFFNKKFSKSPEQAFKYALKTSVSNWLANYTELHAPDYYFDFDNAPYINNDKFSVLMENNQIEYDKNNKVLRLTRFFTLHMATPKPIHYERFYAGEYEFYKVVFEIQVLETIPATPTLNDLCPGFDSNEKQISNVNMSSTNEDTNFTLDTDKQDFNCSLYF